MKAATVKSTGVKTPAVEAASSVKTTATVTTAPMASASVTSASVASASCGSHVESGCHDRNCNNSDECQRNIAGFQHIVLHQWHGDSESRQRNGSVSNIPGRWSVPVGRACPDAPSQPFVLEVSPLFLRLALRHPGGQPCEPRLRGFELRRELQQPILFAETRDELHPPRKPIGGPVGVQFVARFGEEDRLLQLAAQLETAQPWFTRLPAWVTQG